MAILCLPGIRSAAQHVRVHCDLINIMSVNNAHNINKLAKQGHGVHCENNNLKRKDKIFVLDIDGTTL